ncbi:MAG: tetratricopeptide repeat protein [Sandaracinaceae bacterium]
MRATMGYYWLYYLGIFGAYWLVDHPAVLVGLGVMILLRRWIPDPWVLLRTFGRIRALREQIAANPANVTARRDLARIYLERLRPGAALKLVDQARERDRDSAELLFLRGLALHETGKHEEALGPLVEAVQVDARVGFGEAFRVAGDALSQLGRHQEAIDAYDRYLEKNSSSIEGHVKVALAHHRAGEAQEAKDALREASRTWSAIPGYTKRKQIGWMARALLYRLWL